MATYTSGGAGITESRDPWGPWTEWRKTTSLWPRRSITGKMIVGSMYKRGRNHYADGRCPGATEFATAKELFEGKLKGTA